MLASSLCSCSGCSRAFAPIPASSRAVCRVSSHRITSAAHNTARARGDRSPRLPIGVETSTRPFGRADEPSCDGSGDVAHASSGIRAPSRYSITRRLRRGPGPATVAPMAVRRWHWAAGSQVPPPPPPDQVASVSRSCCHCPRARADIGQAMLQAAQLAIKVGPPLDVKDTAGTPEGAAAAARAAVADGVGLILGPLTSAETAAVAPIARQANVAVLAFTNDPSQVQPGVWTLGITPAQQVRRLVAATTAQGKSQFAALLPDTDFGHAMGQALTQATTASSAAEPNIQFYASGMSAINAATRDVSGYASRRGPIEAQMRAARALGTPEGRRQAQELQKAQVGPPPSTSCFWRTAVWPWRRSPRSCRITTYSAGRYRFSAPRCGPRHQAAPVSSAVPGMPRRIPPHARPSCRPSQRNTERRRRPLRIWRTTPRRSRAWRLGEAVSRSDH